MRRYVYVLTAALVVAGSLLAAPPSLVLPEKVTGKPGQFISIAAQTAGKNVAWMVIDEGLHLFPPELLKDSKTAVVVAERIGQYRVVAVTAVADEISNLTFCRVIVSDKVITEEEAALPVVPPAKLILNQGDSLLLSLQRAYTSDPDGQKEQRLKDLQVVYASLATATTHDLKLVDTNEVFALLRMATLKVMPDTALPFLRRTLDAETGKVIPTLVVLNAGKRAELSKWFTRVAETLRNLR